MLRAYSIRCGFEILILNMSVRRSLEYTILAPDEKTIIIPAVVSVFKNCVPLIPRRTSCKQDLEILTYATKIQQRSYKENLSWDILIGSDTSVYKI